MLSSEKTYEYIVNTSEDFITLINKSYEYEVVNDSYCKILKKPKKDILGYHVSDIWGHDRFEEKIKGHLDKCFTGKDIHYIESFGFGESTKYMHVSYYPYHEKKEITHALVFSHDITKMGDIESKLINYEYRDPLTGLFNRKSLHVILDMELEKARRFKEGKVSALLFVSLSNLLEINHKHGYNTGTMLLENTGIRIKELLRNTDFVFRYDGQELVVILSSLAEEYDPAKVARKLQETITIPYRNKKFDITLRCNIGISIFPQDGNTADELINTSISALGAAIENKEPYLIYNKEIHIKAQRCLKLESDLHRAFEQHQFELYYQPIVELNGTIAGCETLIRWNHPERGFISPVEFIPVAEKNGLIKSIGKWVIYQTIEQMKKWCQLYNIYISINLTPREFACDELKDILLMALKQAGNIKPNLLKLEITESSGMEHPEITIKKMKDLADAGFDIYIDDFGTGQSSLAYLKDIPAKTLKIDKAFVDDIATDRDSRSYLKLIIDLAKNRKKKIVVEGVETFEQYNILKEMDCGFIQGYYFSKPVSAKNFEKLLERKTPLP
ncbi:MAG: EAL domain-containing protein [Deltaproteobacteria bacterium]|nr:EAL domain-containing protein [Deltaproteobacteria bacterium]